MSKRLGFPAPRRASVEVGNGRKRTYRTRPWTAEDVVEARAAGAYFRSGAHEFEDAEAEKLAGLRTRVGPPSMQRWLRGLSVEEIVELHRLLEQEASK